MRQARFSGVVAIIGGTGDLGFGLATRLAKAGVDVVIGSRRREKAVAAVSRIEAIIGKGYNISGEENSMAVRDADVVVLTIPFEGVEEIIGSIRNNLKKECVVVSCIVPLGDGLKDLSAAEYVKSLLGGGVNVVSALHTVSAEVLQKVEEPVGCDTLIMGDDSESKRKIAYLIYMIEGLRPVDGGPLRNSRIVEQITRLLITINKKYKVTHSGIRITGLDDRFVMEGWSL